MGESIEGNSQERLKLSQTVGKGQEWYKTVGQGGRSLDEIEAYRRIWRQTVVPKLPTI